MSDERVGADGLREFWQYTVSAVRQSWRVRVLVAAPLLLSVWWFYSSVTVRPNRAALGWCGLDQVFYWGAGDCCVAALAALGAGALCLLGFGWRAQVADQQRRLEHIAEQERRVQARLAEVEATARLIHERTTVLVGPEVQACYQGSVRGTEGDRQAFLDRLRLGISRQLHDSAGLFPTGSRAYLRAVTPQGPRPDEVVLYIPGTARRAESTCILITTSVNRIVGDAEFSIRMTGHFAMFATDDITEYPRLESTAKLYRDWVQYLDQNSNTSESYTDGGSGSSFTQGTSVTQHMRWVGRDPTIDINRLAQNWRVAYPDAASRYDRIVNDILVFLRREQEKQSLRD